jgi:chloramphenicol 3-O phosphotransferase
MLPAKMFGDPDGLVFETILDQGKPSVLIRTGPVVERAMQGMRHAIAAMAATGNNIVVDDVMMGPEEREYRTLLSRFDVRLVGLFAPLEVLEARERERGDREIGLARWQHDRVHRDITYDLEIDAAATTPLENAQQICDAFGL